MIPRRKTKIIKIGSVKIGGSCPIAIQSMTKKKTSRIKGTVRQIRDLEKEGCQIVRLAIKDFEDAKAVREIRKQIRIPLVGDIHFNFKLGIEAIKGGIDKIRLNPGNIYKKDEIKEIVKCAKDYRIPIRVGINSGSLMKSKISTRGARLPLARPIGGQGFTFGGKNNIADIMVKEVLDYIKILEDLNFFDIVISLKASNLLDTISAYRKMAKLCDYPFHLGVTATGPYEKGSIKSAIGIGVLLAEGIGDTIRVSLTSSPLLEVKVAKDILRFLDLRKFGLEIISCPTCGRCEVNLVKIVRELENKVATRYSLLATQPMKVAVMGCMVNGPGEAKDADIGIAFGKEKGLIFKRGKIIKKVDAKNSIDALLKEMEALR